MRIHFWHHSYHRRKAVAKSFVAMDLVTPSMFFFKLFWSRLWATSAFFTWGNKKKAASAKSSEYAGCRNIWIL